MWSGKAVCRCGHREPYRGGAVRGVQPGRHGVDVRITCDTCRSVQQARNLFERRRLRIPRSWRGREPGVPARCQRCHGGPVHRVSRFDPDWICEDCAARKCGHPDCPATEQAVYTEARRQYVNFAGIGFPPELASRTQPD